MKRFRQRKAFTIVEMVIVIAVIAILATVLVPTISGVIQKANHSADQQFVASLNVQLALWPFEKENGGKEITSEADLREAINYYYGDEGAEDFYATLSPKSAAQGYRYWYDYTNGVVYLETVEGAQKMAENNSLAAAEESKVQFMSTKFDSKGNPMPLNNQNDKSFSPASLRTDLISGLYLMDATGEENGIVDLISSFETMDIGKLGADYQDNLAAMYEMQESYKDEQDDNPYKLLLSNFVAKVETTAIITATGVYRYADVNSIENVYIVMGVEEVKLTKVFQYDRNATGEDPVDEGSVVAIANPSIESIELPKGTTVSNLALMGFKNANDTTDHLEDTTTLYVDSSEAELKNLFGASATDCVIELPNGSRYVVESSGIYSLPRRANDTPIHSDLNSEGFSEIEWNISCDDESKDYLTKGGKLYLSGSDLYVAYDITDGKFDLGVTGVDPSVITWSCDSELITVDRATGEATIKAGATTADFEAEGANPVTITATLNGGGEKTVNVKVVYPVYATFTLNDVTAMQFPGNLTTEHTFLYDGSKTEYTFGDFLVVTSDPETVDCDATVTYELSGSLFTASEGKLTLNTNQITNYANGVTLKMICGDYFEQEFTIKVNDTTANPFQPNFIVDKGVIGEYDEGLDLKVGEKYLFRVGNTNKVPLDKLFLNSKPSDSITVVVYDVLDSNGANNPALIYTKAQHDANASNPDYSFYADNHTYTFTAEQWKNGNVNIQFYGKGVATIKIGKTGDDESTYASVMVEVVDGKNIVSLSDWTDSGNRILLSDLTMNKLFNVNKDTYLWGNGYTLDMQTIGESKNGSNAETGLIVVSGTLDNVQVVGPVFTTYSGKHATAYSVSTVVVRAGGTVANCHISNGRAPLRIDGDAVVDNTTLVGGRYANVDIRGGHVTLRDITTVNQPKRTNNVNDKENVFGLGIVVYIDAPAAGTSVTLAGTLTQHNYVKQSDKQYLPDGDVKDLFDIMFGFNKFKHSNANFDGGNTYVSTGIVLMNGDNDLKGAIPSNYSSDSKTMSMLGASATGYVYTLDNTKYTTFDGSELNYGGYMPSKQYTIAPSYSFNHSKNESPVNGNDYCKADSATNEVTISMDLGDTFNWDPMILTPTKLYKNLTYTVTLMKDGVPQGDYTNKTIPFTTAGDYVVKYEYKDIYNYLVSGENLITNDISYTKYVTITVLTVKPDAKAASFDFNGQGYRKVQISEKFYYIMPDVSATSSTIGKKTVNGVEVYYPIVEAYNKADGGWNGKNTGSWRVYFPVFWNVITITDYADGGTGAAVNYNASTNALPAGLSVKNPTTTFQYSMSNAAPADPVFWNNHLAYTCAEGLTSGNARNEMTINAEYTYVDNAGNTYYYFVAYHCKAHEKTETCFTPDTLVTLADGTQKRVDELLPTDKILAWDFFTGKYVEKKISLLVNHGEDLYKVINLKFSDGTDLRLIGEHGVFDYDLNKYVYFTAENYAEYIGHNFVKQNLNGGYDLVQLVDGTVTEEYTSAWSVSSAETSNAFASGMLTVAPPEDFYNWIEMSGKLQYNVEQFAADVEKYGLYTYEDFADYVTYEQFVEWNGAYLKIAVEKGYFTFEYILELIELYKGWMP